MPFWLGFRRKLQNYVLFFGFYFKLRFPGKLGDVGKFVVTFRTFSAVFIQNFRIPIHVWLQTVEFG